MTVGLIKASFHLEALLPITFVGRWNKTKVLMNVKGKERMILLPLHFLPQAVLMTHFVL